MIVSGSRAARLRRRALLRAFAEKLAFGEDGERGRR